jgi:glutamate synthase domain-containing protein 3
MLRGQAGFAATGLRITTADRSFGAGLSGAIERGEVRGPVRLELHGAAGQSFGAFAPAGVELRLVGPANDYVGKGLSGGTLVVAPEADLAAPPEARALVGNTCLYGATSGRLHVLGSAGMRFAVRNSGATAVVEGVGPHGAEYMTGGTLVVLGPVGANLGAGMTGGRVYLHDPSGEALTALHAPSVTARRLADLVGQAGQAGEPEAARAVAAERMVELVGLLADHRAAGSGRAAALLAEPDRLAAETWLVEPVAAPAAPVGLLVAGPPSRSATAVAARAGGAAPLPDRNRGVPRPEPTRVN